MRGWPEHRPHPETGDAVVEPYQDRTNSVENRVEDLLARLTLEDKAGLMFHDIIRMAPGGRFMSSDNPFGRPATEMAIRDMRINHFNLAGHVDDVPELVAWHNRVLYLAAGIRVALHPQIDLATEPRWARIGMTFGEDADLTSRLVSAYIRGFQGAELGPASVATMTKHFPGGGPQQDGEDPHFAYGREQVYPGGEIEYHLKPFRAAIAAGTSQIMPYYGMPIGTDWEEVGFAFSHGVITELLRNELGFDGIVCTDWGLISDGVIMGQSMPARAWGVEHLSELDRAQKIIDAGCDQFGGESRPELVVELVRSGRVSEDRIDESVRRLLREKFVLGLFDQPFLDVDRAVATIGRADFVAEGEAAQRAAMVRLIAADSGPAALPVGTDQAVYIENIGSAAAARLGRVVDDPADADLAVLRLNAPYEPRPGGFEAFFHADSLEFPAVERDRIVAVCKQVPTIIVLFLDRPAIVSELADAAAALLVEFGAQDDAVVDVLLGEAQPRGRLPFDLPSSMKAVIESRSDVPFDTAEPRFRFGDGIVGSQQVPAGSRS